MSLKTKAAIKTQLDAVAAALTLAFADTVSGVASEMKDPRTPLRDVNNLLNITPGGVVAVDVLKWNAMWNEDGDVYQESPQATSKGSITKAILP